MKRGIVYYGALPQDTDLLNVQKNAYVGLAKLAAAILGTNTIFHSLAATPGTGLSVSIGPGQVYSLANIDTNAYGSLAPDTAHQILKQGVNLDSTVLNVPAPGTAGQSINYLVQAQFQEVDGGPVVLPYYNSANPQVALSGQNNNGQAQNTYRDNIVALSVKAGTAAATGSQTTPAADSGWTGLYVVNVANGQTSISAGNITTAAGAPFLTNQLYNFANGLTVGGALVANGGINGIGGATLSLGPDNGRQGNPTLRFTQMTANAAAGIALMPNGTSNISSVRLYNGSDQVNTGDIHFQLSGNQASMLPQTWGTGITPVTFAFPSLRVLVNTQTDNGADALQVAGAISATQSTGSLSFIKASNSGTTDAGYQASNTSQSWGWGVRSSLYNAWNLHNFTSGTDPFNVTTSGRVLIGTTADNGTDALQVNGASFAKGTGLNTRAIKWGSTSSAQSCFWDAGDTSPGGNPQWRPVLDLVAGGTNSYSWDNMWRWEATHFGSPQGATDKNGNALRLSALSSSDSYGTLNPVVQFIGAGRVIIGNAADNVTDALQVNGSIFGGDLTISRATGSQWHFQAPSTDLRIVADATAGANANLILSPYNGRVIVGKSNPSTPADNGVDMLQVYGDITATGKIKENGNPIAPAGKITYFAQSTVPAGYLKANGAAISRTTYASLFSAIGTTFGAGDNSTTFNVPDLRGEFIRGFDDGRGVDSGRAFGSWQADQMGSHTHTYTEYGAGSSGSFQSGGKYGASTTGSNDALTTNATGGTTNSNENRPRNVALLACIKY